MSLLPAWNDGVNALVEGVGGALVWWNVYAMHKHKSLRGVTWQSQAYGLGWNAWHLIYYSSIPHWYSFSGELFGGTAVMAWLALAWRYRKN